MELILKTNNESSIAEIIELAKKLNVSIERRDKFVDENKETQTLKDRILNFQAKGPSSFGDAGDWQRNERNDREFPFTK